MKKSREIEELKKKEEEKYVVFAEKKKKYYDLVVQVKSKSEELEAIEEKLGIEKQQKRKEEEKKEKEKIAHSAEEVHAKMKRGEKLTNEDLLILQASDEEE